MANLAALYKAMVVLQAQRLEIQRKQLALLESQGPALRAAILAAGG